MWRRVLDYLIDHKDRQRIAIGLAKGVASMQARQIDPGDPGSWEFSGLSQNGEDGIVEVLRSQLQSCNRYLVEIGAGEGTENNSSWLLLTQGYEALLVEGDPAQIARTQRNVVRYSIGTECLPIFVTLDSVETILRRMRHRDPDVFSLDIDGNDFHVARALFESGFRPRIAVVEYNSAFGPDRRVTSSYEKNFKRSTAHPSLLYYGASVSAWKAFFSAQGYRFVTVDSKGVNAFFVNPAFFDQEFLDGIAGASFEENRYQLRAHGTDHTGQFSLIDDQSLEHV